MTSYSDAKWTSSLHFLQLNMRGGLKCGLFLWNGAIAACDHWPLALALLQELEGEMKLADVISFNAAMEGSHEWKMTCLLYASMACSGLRSTEISPFESSGQLKHLGLKSF